MADVETFLKLIKAMESSGGKDLEHKTITKGIHKGDTAVGAYGIMPNTAKEIAQRRIQAGLSTEHDESIRASENSTVEAMLKDNPQLAEEYARYMAEMVLKRNQNDPIAGMTAWHYGHNLPYDRVKRKMQENPAYVKKVYQRIQEEGLADKLPGVYQIFNTKNKDK